MNKQEIVYAIMRALNDHNIDHASKVNIVVSRGSVSVNVTSTTHTTDCMDYVGYSEKLQVKQFFGLASEKAQVVASNGRIWTEDED